MLSPRLRWPRDALVLCMPDVADAWQEPLPSSAMLISLTPRPISSVREHLQCTPSAADARQTAWREPLWMPSVGSLLSATASHLEARPAADCRLVD